MMTYIDYLPKVDCKGQVQLADYLLKSRGQRPNPVGSGKLVVLSRYDALKLHAGQFPDILRAVIANQDACQKSEMRNRYCTVRDTTVCQ